MSAGKVTVFEFAFLAVLITGIVLFSQSFSTVPVNSVGIKQSIYSKTIDPEAIYSSGMYMIGIPNKFITYPRGYQRLLFSNTPEAGNINQQTNVISNTLDGTQVSFSALIYYTYIPELLAQLYSEYPSVDQHTQVLAKAAKTVMAAVINQYRYNDLLVNRSAFSAQMSYRISQQFLLTFYVKFKLLLITDIVLESAHEQALISTFQLKQGELSSQANNTINSIQANISLLTAQTNNIIASNGQTTGIQGAAQQGNYLLVSEALKFNATNASLTQLKSLFTNQSEFTRCLQMVNLFLSDDSNVVWNSDFISR